MEKKPINEIQMLAESDKMMRCRERLEEFHIENYDFKAALADKWALASLAQGRI